MAIGSSVNYLKAAIDCEVPYSVSVQERYIALSALASMKWCRPLSTQLFLQEGA